MRWRSSLPFNIHRRGRYTITLLSPSVHGRCGRCQTATSCLIVSPRRELSSQVTPDRIASLPPIVAAATIGSKRKRSIDPPGGAKRACLGEAAASDLTLSLAPPDAEQVIVNWNEFVDGGVVPTISDEDTIVLASGYADAIRLPPPAILALPHVLVSMPLPSDQILVPLTDEVATYGEQSEC